MENLSMQFAGAHQGHDLWLAASWFAGASCRSPWSLFSYLFGMIGGGTASQCHSGRESHISRCLLLPRTRTVFNWVRLCHRRFRGRGCVLGRFLAGSARAQRRNLRKFMLKSKYLSCPARDWAPFLLRLEFVDGGSASQ